MSAWLAKFTPMTLAITDRSVGSSKQLPQLSFELIATAKLLSEHLRSIWASARARFLFVAGVPNE
jgi:hypothetical protein